METVSVLLARCEGNPPVTGGFSSQGANNADFDVFFDVNLNKQLNKQSGDLRRQDVHCTVKISPFRCRGSTIP